MATREPCARFFDRRQREDYNADRRTNRRVTRSEETTQESLSWIGVLDIRAPSSACADRLSIPRGQTFPSIVGNGAINDRATVDTLPRVENEKEI